MLLSILATIGCGAPGLAIFPLCVCGDPSPFCVVCPVASLLKDQVVAPGLFISFPSVGFFFWGGTQFSNPQSHGVEGI